jgi:hypothetical protein
MQWHPTAVLGICKAETLNQWNSAADSVHPKGTASGTVIAGARSRRRAMSDLFSCMLTIGFFALAWLYLKACAWIAGEARREHRP